MRHPFMSAEEYAPLVQSDVLQVLNLTKMNNSSSMLPNELKRRCRAIGKVLGDNGEGKTFKLKVLRHALLSNHPDVLPIIVSKVEVKLLCNELDDDDDEPTTIGSTEEFLQGVLYSMIEQFYAVDNKGVNRRMESMHKKAPILLLADVDTATNCSHGKYTSAEVDSKAATAAIIQSLVNKMVSTMMQDTRTAAGLSGTNITKFVLLIDEYFGSCPVLGTPMFDSETWQKIVMATCDFFLNGFNPVSWLEYIINC